MCILMSVHGPNATIFLRSLITIATPDLPTFSCGSAFAHPEWPIVSGAPRKLELARWGLVPFWCTTADKAAQIRKRTVNARSEGMLEAPNFRAPARTGRCVVLVDGFFEFHRHAGVSYPIYCYLDGHRPFVFAGLRSAWRDAESQASEVTFSVVTTSANAIMREVHNKLADPLERRMPVILSDDQVGPWLDPATPVDVVMQITAPREIPGFRVHPVSRDLNNAARRMDSAAAQQRVDYPELSDLLRKLPASSP